MPTPDLTYLRTAHRSKRQARFYELHFAQAIVLQAPLLLAICAASHRTGLSLAQRAAGLIFGNLISCQVAAIDAIVVAQFPALTRESQGMSICYVGTTLIPMGEIVDSAERPDYCIPVTSLALERKGFLP